MKIISNIEKINKSEKRARKGWGLHLIGRFFFFGFQRIGRDSFQPNIIKWYAIWGLFSAPS